MMAKRTTNKSTQQPQQRKQDESDVVDQAASTAELADAAATKVTEQHAASTMLATVSDPHKAIAFAQAETARARVEARYVLALKKPRNFAMVRSTMLSACQRTAFAESARYELPIGNGFIYGFSIRFAEEAMQSLTNIDIDAYVIYEDQNVRQVGVSVLDLERNLSYSGQSTLQKTVERKYLREDQKAISVRVNSQGQRTYLVEATESDMLAKTNAQISKIIRTQGLRLLPADIKEDCQDAIMATISADTKADPDRALKDVLDGCMKLKINPKMIEAFLGQKLTTISPAQIDTLRALYAAIRDGEATWASIVQAKKEEDAEKAVAKKRADKNKTDKGSLDNLKPGAEGGAEAEAQSQNADAQEQPPTGKKNQTQTQGSLLP